MSAATLRRIKRRLARGDLQTRARIEYGFRLDAETALRERPSDVCDWLDECSRRDRAETASRGFAPPVIADAQPRRGRPWTRWGIA